MYDYEYTGEPEVYIYTREGTLVAFNFNRVVLGDRGAYVEFLAEQIHHDALRIPDDALWRLYGERGFNAYYVEYRTTDNIKVYAQKKRVDYADYIPGRYYISPVSLLHFVRKKI